MLLMWNKDGIIVVGFGTRKTKMDFKNGTGHQLVYEVDKHSLFLDRK